jgi:hypothetical protein
MGNIIPRAIYKHILPDSEGIVAHLHWIYQSCPLISEKVCDIMRAEEGLEFSSYASNHF